jgi:hypothetical protein
VSSTSGRRAWLSLTPEPERELPVMVATLRSGGRTSATAVDRERELIERLVVLARRRRWLAYLREVVSLIEHAAGDPDPDVERARAVAIEVVQNHHRLLLGVPGPAARETAGDRARLDAAAAAAQTATEGA